MASQNSTKGLIYGFENIQIIWTVHSCTNTIYKLYKRQVDKWIFFFTIDEDCEEQNPKTNDININKISKYWERSVNILTEQNTSCKLNHIVWNTHYTHIFDDRKLMRKHNHEKHRSISHTGTLSRHTMNTWYFIESFALL